MRHETDYSLKHHNTFGIDMRCRDFYEFESEEELIELLPKIRGERLLVIGAGANLVFTNDYFDGVVLHSAIKGVDVFEKSCTVLTICCGSGENWDNVVDRFIDNGWYGAENLSLIPGEVGATAVQNIGAYGVEAKDLIACVKAVEIATGKVEVFNDYQCEFGYRTSRFKTAWKDKYIITYVGYNVNTDFIPHLDYGNLRAAVDPNNLTAREVRNAIIKMRRSKLPDPEEIGSAGSFFMNPVIPRSQYEELLAANPEVPHYDVDADHVKVPAAWLIDQCGWKGKSMGRAGVYEKQALVLVNRGGATGNDVIALAKAITADVEQRFGVTLKPEAIFV